MFYRRVGFALATIGPHYGAHYRPKNQSDENGWGHGVEGVEPKVLNQRFPQQLRRFGSRPLASKG